MPVRALGREGGWDTDIANAIRWAAGIDVTDEAGNTIAGADPPADIINMSFGGQGTSAVLTEAVQEAYAAGAILRITSYNVCYTKLLRSAGGGGPDPDHAAGDGARARGGGPQSRGDRGAARARVDERNNFV